jgi:rhamnose transport system permease protein
MSTLSTNTPPVDTARTSGAPNRWRTLLLSQEVILLIITAIVVVIIALRTDRFLTPTNLLNQARLMIEVGLIALPMTYIIITGGIDLSVGSIFGFSAIILGFAWQDSGLPLEVAIVIGLLVATVCGFVNGFFIVRIGVPPLIMTLATLALYRGLALGVSEARSARGFPEWFFELGSGDTLGIPNQIYVLVICAILFAVVLSRLPFGRWLYAIGNNEIGARFAGIPVARTKLIIYTLSGLMSGLAAWVFTSRITTTRSDMGTGLELDVIAAVVLGGTSIFGGSGSIAGTMIGLVLIQILKNGLSLSGMRGDATIVIIGLIIITAVLVNTFIQRRFR